MSRRIIMSRKLRRSNISMEKNVTTDNTVTEIEKVEYIVGEECHDG